MGEALHDVRCSMGREGVLRLGASPRMRSDVQFAACAETQMPQTSILPQHRTKDGSLPRTRLPISVAVFKSKPTPRKKAEASRAHRPLARSLNLPRVVQGRHERVTTPHAALAPQYNKSREGQLSWLYFNGLWQIQPRATSPLMEYGEFNRGIQSFNGLPQTQPHRPALQGWR